jgi:hypothetical protein
MNSLKALTRVLTKEDPRGYAPFGQVFFLKEWYKACSECPSRKSLVTEALYQRAITAYKEENLPEFTIAVVSLVAILDRDVAVSTFAADEVRRPIYKTARSGMIEMIETTLNLYMQATDVDQHGGGRG